MNPIIPLIANSGIQFIEQRVNLGEETEAFINRSRFAEIVTEEDPSRKEYELVFPYLFKKKEKYIIRDSINDEAFDKKTGKIQEDNIKDKYVEYINERRGDKVYSVQGLESIETYEGAWLPLPYFRKAGDNKVHPGPYSWSRMWFSKIPSSERKDDGATHYVVLAYDTRTESSDTEEYYVPKELDAEQGSVFKCSDNDDATFNFCGLPWVQQWLEREFETGKKRNYKYQFYHLSLYFNLVKVLRAAGAFPEVSLHSPEQFDTKLSNEVDLILDIGNSRTCGLLYETSKVGKPFSFTDAVPLQIRDLTYPGRTYSDPFSMMLAFTKAEFGKDIIIPDNTEAFKWPSFLRIGDEAKRLIVINNKLSSNFTMSSPKRYLWDKQKTLFPWEFIVNNAENLKNVSVNGAIIPGLTELFTTDGVLLEKAKEIAENKGLSEPEMGVTPYYSRKSLMTFVFVEIFMQTLTFINSYTFRKKHGNERIPRRLKRIVLTCPTAMTQEERFYLRDLAGDALKAISKIFDERFINIEEIEIIPDPKDIKTLAGEDIDPDQKTLIKDWGYDEATCSQLTFLYGEIVQRYKSKSNLFISVNGKQRKNTPHPDQPALTVASVDIGGGTTDLMIASYQTSPEDESVITADPEFWEGFNLAGDDISRRIIETLILPPIAQEAKNKSCNNIVEVMSFLFGHDMQAQTEEDRHFRKQFAQQAAIPMSFQFIQHAVDEQENLSKSFKEFFYHFPHPNLKLIQYINDKFRRYGAEDFDIRDVEWELNAAAVNETVKKVVEKMLKKLSIVIAQYQVDYLLLAGRPTTLPVIREIFLKYLPTFTDRIIPLGNYRIGRWYPFADASGRIRDPKTCVSVGATISLMSKLGQLNGFRFETGLLKDKQKSTAEYLGKFDPDKDRISQIYFTPRKNFNQIIFNSPMLLGMKQLEDEDWIGTPIYKLDFASPEKAAKLSSRMPLKIDMTREYHENKEKIESIEAITDKDGEEVMPGDITVKIQTLPDEFGYWTDTGKFTLPIF